jgi:hypothetical protein
MEMEGGGGKLAQSGGWLVDTLLELKHWKENILKWQIQTESTTVSIGRAQTAEIRLRWGKKSAKHRFLS